VRDEGFWKDVMLHKFKWNEGPFTVEELVTAATLVLLVRFLYNSNINKTKQVHQWLHWVRR